MIRLRLAFALALALLCCDVARALEIREKRWGFDGRVRPARFNILSVLAANPEARDFDGQLTLESKGDVQRNTVPAIVQPLFLSAGTQRWVQFHVFVHESGGEWVLRWGAGVRDSETFNGAEFSAPARVLLIDPESPFAAKPAMRAFPDDLFPTTVAATDALDAVVLDHVPRWEAARREAFLDWLQRGGTVHLIHGADAQFPRFPDALSVLNAEGDWTRAGSGVVVRHAVSRSEMSENYLETHGFHAPEYKTDKKVFIYDLDMQLLQKLAALTKPRIAWWLIFLLAGGYLVVVGPVHYRWSKRIAWLPSLALFVALVAGFGAAFAYAGRRGASEQQQIQVLAIAQSLGGGRYDVMQWASAFVTRGDFYRIAHAAPAGLYGMGGGFDSAKGAIFNGRDGHFDVDIPLYSTRPFVHRAVLTGDRADLSVADWQVDASGRLASLALVPGEGFPKVTHAWVQHGDRYETLKESGGRWVLDGSDAKAEDEFFSDTYFQRVLSNGGNFVPFMFGRSPEDEAARDMSWMNEAGALLIARALGDVEGLRPFITRPPSPLPLVRLRVFLYAPLPDGFRMQDARFKTQQGHVLYWQELFKP